MLKIALGLVTALMLAACSYAPPQTVAALDGHTSGVGHPSGSYPGPRVY